jgi:serine/threonine protein phosphatase PrpC
MVALFVAGRLYVANAGDSRALATLEKEEKSTGWRQMSTDFTPETDRQRVQHIAFHRPELLRHPQSREKLFNR